MGLSYRRATCRGCGNRDLHLVLALGNQPLANRFVDEDSAAENEPMFPLDLYYCGQCHLVQILEVVSPEALFANYIYVTGTSETIAEHNQRYAKSVVDRMALRADDLVVEVASNDGSLLRAFQTHRVKTLGVEPASNIARLAEDSGVETVNRFFSRLEGERLRAERGGAKAVVANNVLAHVDEPIDFLLGAAALLDPDGCVVVEVPYLLEFLDRLEYDTIYHEHLCYFSVSALQHIFEQAGLTIFRVDEVSVHGGSIRVWAALSASKPSIENTKEFLERERSEGALQLDRYLQLAKEVSSSRTQLNAMVDALLSEGRSLAAYGAPAKGNTLLNYCQLSTSKIPYTVDRSPHKIGKRTPGMHIPVLDASELEKRQPDYTLILAWNFAEEIMRQQACYIQKGGRFILPLPEPRIVP